MFANCLRPSKGIIPWIGQEPPSICYADLIMIIDKFSSSLKALHCPTVRLLPVAVNMSLFLKSCSLSTIIDSRAGGPGGLNLDATLNLEY